ncbi:T3SS effector HopA1 family protein [Streptomyces sp. NBC_00122]|uniref:T3SS effector HopA1 family protein n=1 Tax=Streptomyces sp. NBC_00122 TaxID=2903623 RepID=UPI0032491888
MSSPTPSPVLSERLRSALEELEVDPGALTARVLDTTVTASTLPELRHALAYKIYEVLHAGMTLGDEPALRTLRDRRYERLLSDAVAHHDTLVEASVTEAATSADNARRIATIDGVRTLVDAPAPADAQVARRADRDRFLLRYPSRRPALSPGFFLVDGSRGRPRTTRLRRYYLHIEDAAAAPQAWGQLLTVLEGGATRYRAKISSNPLYYPRRDAIVVYLDDDDAALFDAAGIAAVLTGLGRTTSVFARELAPGVSSAEEPSDSRPGMARMSFGQHRSHAVAEGLMDHALHPAGPTAEAAVCSALAQANIVPHAPWMNGDGR